MSLLCLDHVTKYYPSQALPAVHELSLELAKGEILALLGPSGCGKTTTLRLIAGFEAPDAGSVEIGGKTVANDGIFVPPEQRGVGVVFQEYTLFPHLTVEDNVRFGLHRLGAGDRTQRLREMLEAVGLSSFARRYPHELSGGQQQRVALARALAPRPAVVLLDEPFSHLDADLRRQMSHEVYTILRELGTTAVFVTHDHEEAFMVADRVGVLNGGRLEQLSRPEDIYHQPTSPFVARFVGHANFLPGRVLGTGIDTDIGSFANTAQFPQDAAVEVMIRPYEIELQPDPAGNGLVTSCRFRGADTRVVVRLTSGVILESYQPSRSGLQTRMRVKVRVKPGHVVAFLTQLRA